MWSLGLSVAAYGLPLPFEKKIKLVSTTDKIQVTPFEYPQIPSRIFAIVNLFSHGDMNPNALDSIDNLSNVYCN